jgi:hypothetical protein
MRSYGISMKVTCDTEEVLAQLQRNRGLHAQIVAEARQGYVAQAKKALAKRLDELAAGKVVALTFSLRVPADHTAEYDTVIHMLQMHKAKTIELNADETRQLIEDKWDWSRDFLWSNKGYSETAAAAATDLEAPG